MKFKNSTRIFGVRPEMVWAAMVVEGVYCEMDNLGNCVITSCVDGKHKRGSDHYAGLAFDVRVWGFTEKQKDTATKALRERLTPEFEVFNEGDHIHIGFDPQQGLDS